MTVICELHVMVPTYREQLSLQRHDLAALEFGIDWYGMSLVDMASIVNAFDIR